MSFRNQTVYRKQVLPLNLIVALGLLAILTFTSIFFIAPARAAGVQTLTGSINGAAYLIQVPPNWNGTLVLYSHGYQTPNLAAPGAPNPNPPTDAGDPITGNALLAQGYALAGSAYRSTGWALEDAFKDQTALLDYFNTQFGKPQRTIAWGHSLGGIITAGLVQKFPQRFDAALPMCGVLSGGVGTWNQALDATFAFKVLLASTSPLQLVHITNPGGNLGLAEQLLAQAQATPQGRARLALVAAFGDTPGWFDPTSAEPASNDYASREYNQFLWSKNVNFPFVFAFRAELEARSGGNPSWNTGVNYRVQLAHSINRDEVRALYREAGLNLEQDLEALEDAPRISADPKAVSYLSKNISFNGEIHIPVLTMHTSGDGLVVPQNEETYAKAVEEAGNNRWLREIFIDRAGHCSFTPAETLAAFQTLVNRLNTGRWDGSTRTELLNSEATALGPQFNVLLQAGGKPTAPAFFNYKPSQFLRPFTLVRGDDDRKRRDD
ncbi:MAG TPA: prolyl oligopeptidase family serine peptidase [Chloroflexia bacterium]|nr:prolyl oligopeptidase family serine peptidase [Chloroflexia bacterium]